MEHRTRLSDLFVEPFWVFEDSGPVFALSTNRVDGILPEGFVDVILVLGDTTASSIPYIPLSADLCSLGSLYYTVI